MNEHPKINEQEPVFTAVEVSAALLLGAEDIRQEAARIRAGGDGYEYLGKTPEDRAQFLERVAQHYEFSSKDIVYRLYRYMQWKKQQEEQSKEKSQEAATP